MMAPMPSMIRFVPVSVRFRPSLVALGGLGLEIGDRFPHPQIGHRSSLSTVGQCRGSLSCVVLRSGRWERLRGSRLGRRSWSGLGARSLIDAEAACVTCPLLVQLLHLDLADLDLAARVVLLEGEMALVPGLGLLDAARRAARR